MMIFSGVSCQPTTAEREMAYHTPVPEAVLRLRREVDRLRAAGEHVGASDLERDACALIRMAQAETLWRLAAARVLSDPPSNLSEYVRREIADRLSHVATGKGER